MSIQLPSEYAKGLETLLLKEQQNDQMGVQTEIQQKQVLSGSLKEALDQALAAYLRQVGG